MTDRAWHAVYAGTGAADHPLLLTNRSGDWALTSPAFESGGGEPTGAGADVAAAAFAAGRHWVVSGLGGAQTVGGTKGPGWATGTSRSLLSAADWALVEVTDHATGSQIVIRNGSSGARRASLITEAIRQMDAVCHRGRSFAADPYLACILREPQDVVLVKCDMQFGEADLRQIVRLRHCTPRDIAIASTPHSLILALLFDRRCDLLDAGEGRIVATAALDPDWTVLIEGPGGSRFLAGDRVVAVPRFGYHGESLIEAARQPIRANGYRRGDVPSDPEPVFLPYVAWSESGLTHPAQADDAEAKAVLKRIVAAEGPMLAELAYLRYVQASGGQEVTAAAKRRLNPLVTQLVRAGELRMIKDDVVGVLGKTLYLPETPPVVVRRPGGRTAAQVPSSELLALLQEMEVPILGPGVGMVLLQIHSGDAPSDADIAHCERTIKGYRWQP